MTNLLAGGGILLTVIYAINILIAIGIIFVERKDPTSTLAWICVLMFLPVIGLPLYLVFSQNISRRRIFRLSKNEEYLSRKALKEQISAIECGGYPLSLEAREREELLRFNLSYSGAYYTQDNAIDVLSDGEKLYADLTKSIAAARQEVNVESYILQDDEVGRGIIEVLTRKAREGVKVRLLMDAMGSNRIRGSRLADFKAAGGECGFFFDTGFRVLNLRLNYRNHRKIAVIDRSIAYVGGFNIGREYLGRDPKYGYWRDSHWKITGGAVRDLNTRFLFDWREATKENVSLHDVDYPPHYCGATGVQIVSGGPETKREELKVAYMKMITSARKNVYVQTPYFVPDQCILESLKMAAHSGVDVRLMIPNKCDNAFVQHVNMSCAAELLEAGGRVFLYDHGFIHAKTIVVDGEVSACGSANFDRRSFSLNFETNAFAYSREIAMRMEDLFKKDLQFSHELTKELYDSRGVFARIKESVARLLSALL